MAVVSGGFINTPAKDQPGEVDDSQVQRTGSELPGFYGVDDRLQAIWEEVKRLTGLSGGHPAPRVHLQTFELERLDPDFRKWQKEWTRSNYNIWKDWFGARDIEITQEWINTNIDSIYPFPKTFLAFHYDGTNVIQINPN